MSATDNPPVDLLRLSTAGSVDDGKSTLIGRLLYERNAIYDDHLQAIEHASKEAGETALNLALITDGLRAEREQGITIDVAYRPFSTPRRRFVIADTPGHAQYTRNMATGTSGVDLSVILTDASRGLTEQSRRHSFIAALLRVPHVVICVNKMDLVDFSEDGFELIKSEIEPFLHKVGLTNPIFIPISALHGDNVVQRSARMPWYTGLSLLEHLEQVEVAPDLEAKPSRFPIQWVIKPALGEHVRGYAGRLASGLLHPGDAVLAMPSGMRTTVSSIETLDGPISEAIPKRSVVVRLADDLDLSRGDLLCGPGEEPNLGQDLAAMVIWFAPTPLREGNRYLIKHTTRVSRAILREIDHRIDVVTLERDHEATTLAMNEIGRCFFRAASPIAWDSYRHNRETGSFIVIDESTNDTVGAGILLDEDEWND